MLNVTQSHFVPRWAEAVLQTGQEFGPAPLRIVEGTLPAGLRGALYRNGPARLERGGQRVGHWFDGDGAVLGVHFNGRTANGVYRFVQTAGYQLEEQAGKLILANFGMLPPGPWHRRFGKPVKNTANTSVLPLADRLLALWEGGPPHRLDLETLETLGLDDLGGLNGQSYSAHPKRDWQTGEIFNFGVGVGKETVLYLYRSSPDGRLRRQNRLELRGTPLIHDFVIAGRYLVFCIPPIQLRIVPLLARLRSYGDALTWKPEQGTEIIVVDRDTLEPVCRFATDPWFQWHFGNAFEREDGSVVVEIARYPDFRSNQRLKEVKLGRVRTQANATLWRLHLDPPGHRVISMQEVLSRSCEFPSIDPREAGRPSRFSYLAMHGRNADLVADMFGTIARFDTINLTLTEADLGQGCYPSEPIYAADADTPDQGWILTVVFDGPRNQSELWVFAADRLDDAPACRLSLPSVIPLGFHGAWRPASA
jgi:carotenoid cleavage dioxygenase-like enzyme